MSEQNPFRIFVTHTFASHPDYHRVFEYLESTPNFFYLNCSAPDEMPGAGGREALKDALREQIKAAEVVIVLSALYADGEYWITYEMDAAQAMNLPLMALEPFGVAEKLPDDIARRVNEVVPWNSRALVDAVRRQARQEETTRWDTIDFDM